MVAGRREQEDEYGQERRKSEASSHDESCFPAKVMVYFQLTKKKA